MTILKFGKEVILEVLDSNNSVIFSSGGLRVDFDIRLMQGFNRAKFSIYNLANPTIKEINNGERYVNLYVKLHDQPMYVLAGDYYVNNAQTEKRVPNNITSLFCIDRLRKDFTSKQLRMILKNPTLKERLQGLIRQSGLKDVEFTTTDIPEEVLNYLPLKPMTSYSGEIDKLLRDAGKEYSFTHHIKGGAIDLMYQPLYRNKELSGQSTRKPIILETSNMRANPIIGLAKLQIDSNLDARIQCNTLLDTSNLITATSEHDFDILTIEKDFLKSSVTGWSIFITLSVQHIGSTHTSTWSTKAIALTSSRGIRLPTYNWFG